MVYTEATVRVLQVGGDYAPNAAAERYLPYIERLDDAALERMHREMVVVRAIDLEGSNLQRQGQLALWIPSLGQEAAQVGSGLAAKKHDHVFPAYREHALARIRGVDPMRIVALLRGLTNGGWDPAQHDNLHIYTLVIGSQALHATGYAMGVKFDGATATGDPDTDQAVIVYFGDGAMSQGDVNEALVFAASYQTPQVFFLQNNHWAISVPVERQSRTPLYLRAGGFGIPGIQVDGNDVLASYAVSAHALDEARSGQGPQFIEALTYRMGAHTTSDDPTKYRQAAELEVWSERDPISRFEAYLRDRGASEAFFAEVKQEAQDAAADIRARTFQLEVPTAARIFENVYSDPHPTTAAQHEWLQRYEAQFQTGGDH
jgi:2-oxoisovalerate dehydrogenase E1 component alpha subunit